MSYCVEQEFYAEYCGDKSNEAMINRIMDYFAEIWGFRDFGAWGNSAAIIGSSDDEPDVDFVSNSELEDSDDDHEWAPGLSFYEIGEADIFYLLNALFDDVHLFGNWTGNDYTGGNSYYYSMEYNPEKMRYIKYYGECGNSCDNYERTKQFPIRYKIPDEEIAAILAAKAEADGQIELASKLHGLTERISNGMTLSDKQKRWNLRIEKEGIRKKIKELLKSIPENDELTKTACGAMKILLRRCADKTELCDFCLMFERFRKLFAYKGSEFINAKEIADLSDTFRSGTGKAVYDRLGCLFDNMQNMRAIRKKVFQNYSDLFDGSEYLTEAERDLFCETVSSVCDETALTAVKESAEYMRRKYSLRKEILNSFHVKNGTCEYLTKGELAPLLNALEEAFDEKAMACVRGLFAFLQKKYSLREDIQCRGYYLKADIAELANQIEEAENEETFAAIDCEARLKISKYAAVDNAAGFSIGIMFTAAYKFSSELREALAHVTDEAEFIRAKEMYDRIRSRLAEKNSARMFLITKRKGCKAAFYDENGVERFLNNTNGKHAVADGYIHIPETTQRYLKLADYPQLF